MCWQLRITSIAESITNSINQSINGQSNTQAQPQAGVKKITTKFSWVGQCAKEAYLYLALQCSRFPRTFNTIERIMRS